MKQNLLILFSSFLLAACGYQNLESSENPAGQSGIFGGERVTLNDAVAKMTVLLYHTTDQYLCTGSLYGKNLVITAAHCLEGDLTKLQVRFGVSMAKASVIRKVIAGERNPNYLNGRIAKNMGDIALLKYEGTLPEGFQEVSLLADYRQLQRGSSIIAAGYGVSGQTFRTGAGLLRKITLRIENANYSSTEMSVDQSFFKGVCVGDSGGPAYAQGADGKLYLWGVTSNGAGLPLLRPCMSFAVYTRVDSHLPWLTELAQRL